MIWNKHAQMRTLYHHTQRPKRNKDLKRNIPNGIRVKAGKCYQQPATAVITNYLQPTDSEKCAQDKKQNRKSTRLRVRCKQTGIKDNPAKEPKNPE